MKECMKFREKKIHNNFVWNFYSVGTYNKELNNVFKKSRHQSYLNVCIGNDIRLLLDVIKNAKHRCSICRQAP